MAQDYYGGDVRFGLGVAGNLSWYNSNTENYESDGSRAGWSWGLNAEYFFTENYALSTGLHMLSYGGKLKYPDLLVTQGPVERVEGNSDVKYTAVNIPVALKMRTAMLSAVNFYGKFGANICINYNVIENYETNNASGESVSVEDRDYSDQSKTFNLGLLVGGGAEYNISGNTTAYLGITFNQGILNQLNDKAYLTDDMGVILESERQDPGNPSGPDRKATINYLTLDLGIFF